MRLDFSNFQQLNTFLWAVVLGAALCIVYDVIRFLLSTYNSGGVAVFLSDVLFFSFAGVETFVFFVLFSKGTIRLYALIGEALGFFLFRFIFSPAFRKILALFEKLLFLFLKILSVPVGWLVSLSSEALNFAKSVSRRVAGRIGTFIRKIVYNLKQKPPKSKKVE